MISAGYSPSVRLFEAAACGTPIISDYWDGLDTFFTLGAEILVARTTEDVLRWIREIPDDERTAIGARARERVLAEHTAAHRAGELESYVAEVIASGSRGDGDKSRQSHDETSSAPRLGALQSA